MKNSPTPRVPAVPRWLLTRALPGGHRQHWLGDLAEEYHAHVVPERGRFRARLWYWRQALGSLPSAVRRRAGSGGSMPPHDRRTRPGPGALEGFLLDVRAGVRALWTRPAYSVVAILTLALGIGANVAVFSVVNATVLRALPYGAPDELVRFWPTALFSSSTADVVALRAGVPASQQIAAYGRTLATFTGGAEPELVRGATVTWDHFDVLQTGPLHGRAFVEGEGAPGRDRVIVLEHGFWQRRFGGDVGIVGEAVEIRGEPWRVIGIMPPTHQPLEPDWQFWRPLDLDPDKNSSALAVIGRRTGALTLDQAILAYQTVLVELWATQGYTATPENLAAMVGVPLSAWLLGPWSTRLLLLLGSVGLVLLIACANVGNLTLARTISRGDELALRAALGAGRARVARLLMIEAALVAGIGATTGVMAAWGLVGAVRGGIPVDVPRLERIGVDDQALLYAVAVTVVATLVFGLAPALRGALRAAGPAGGRSTQSANEARMSRAFVTAQVAVAVVLVVGAGLLLRSFWRLQSVDPGFRAESVVALRPAPPSSAYPDSADVRAYHETVTATLLGLPGARSTGGIMFLPMHPGGWQDSYATDRADGTRATGQVGGRVVTPGYFETMEVPVLAGRTFEAQDDGGTPVVIVNRALAREAWPGEEPVGKILRSSETDYTVVGVVGDVHQVGLGTPSTAEMYVPYAQQPWRNMYFTVRIDGDAAASLPLVRAAVRAIDPRVPINNLVAMPQVVAETAAGSRFLAGFVVAFGIVAMTLGMIGVYGVTAYAVARQKRELGIRMAIGAPRRQVLVGTLWTGARPVILGLVLGLGLAAAASRALQGVLFEIDPLDPLTFFAVPAVLVASGLLALWVPALRATRVDPAVVLRDD
jgi:predicted permease